jgi:uncharacterized SAM-binding protein YcdF (DUF218 family)
MSLHNISHFMIIWLFPPGLILLLMLIGFLFSLSGRAIGKKMTIFAFVIFWVLSTPYFAQLLIDGLQKPFPPLPSKILTNNKNSEIVVLGFGVEDAPEYAGKDNLSIKSLARVQYAAYLSSLTHLPVTVSGGNRDNMARSEADLMQSVLQKSFNTPVSDSENTSRNTQEQSTLLVPILKKKNIQQIYLVTNAWHMQRSMYAFKKAFSNTDITIIPAPMGYIALKSQNVFINLLPFLNALDTSVIALYEYLGIFWYRIYYGIG